MSTLNIMCAICGEFYKPADTVYSTTACGHLFHHHCLFRWLARSNTCPQCRRSCHRNRVHRVYLNFGERSTVDDEIEAIASNSPTWMLLDEPTATGRPEPIPAGAIKAGTDTDGNDAFVARAYFEEDLVPANYIPQKGGAYMPWGCKAHFVRNEVEVLLNFNCTWVADANGHVPEHAVETGYSETGEKLYTGRGQYEGLTLPGKVHPSHRVLYMPYNGQEVNLREYEVLVEIAKAGEETNN